MNAIRVSEAELQDELDAARRRIAELESRLADVDRDDGRFRLALRHSPTVVSTQDRDLRYTWFFNAQLNQSAEEVLGRTDEELLAPASASVLTALKRRVLETGQGERVVLELTRRDSEQGGLFDVSIEPLRDTEGQVLGIACAATDLADLEGAEQTIRRLEREPLENTQLPEQTLIRRQLAEAFSRAKDSVMTALRASEERFRVALEHSPIFVFEQDLDLRCTWAYNPPAGSLPEDFLGKTIGDMEETRNVPLLLEMEERVLATGEGLRDLIDLIVDGQSRLFDVTLEPRRDAQGAIVGLVGAAADVTPVREASDQIRRLNHSLEQALTERTAQLQVAEAARRFAEHEEAEHLADEAALRESERHFRLALLHSPITVWDQDPELRYTWLYNPSPGFTAEMMLGHTDADIYPPDVAAPLIALKRGVLETGVGVRSQAEGRRPDGAIVFYDLAVEPLSDAAGNVVGITCAAIDITDIRQADAEIRRLNETLEQRVAERTDQLETAVGDLRREIANRIAAEEEREAMRVQLAQRQKIDAIGVLAGGVAHDFNNLLTAIQGHIELALLKSGAHTAWEENLQQSLQASERAAELTRQLLMFSRRQPIRFAGLNLNAVLRGLLEMLGRIIGEDIQLQIDLSPGLWTVWGDAGTLEQALMNLVVNARDAMPSGGTLRIHTENVSLAGGATDQAGAGAGDFVRVTISDTGVGIAADLLPRIFDPFFTTKGLARGTGLGLSAAYGGVSQHQGWISVHSQVGHGTAFEVYLPALTAELATPADRSGADVLPTAGDVPRGQGQEVLIVEDEPAVRRFTASVLREVGYQVTEATTAEQAHAILSAGQHDFSLVLSDVVLPGQSGLDLADEVLREWPDLRVLLVSGYAEERMQGETIRARGYAFIAKPYSVSALLRAIADALVAPAGERMRG